MQAGDRVGVLMTNHPDLVLSVFGASLVGAVVVPINARYRTSELRFIVDDAQLTALLTHDSADDHVDYAALLEDALGDDRADAGDDGRQASRPASSPRTEFDALTADADARCAPASRASRCAPRR